MVLWTPYRLKAGSSSASTAVTTTGKYSGAQPAIVALTASFSTVAMPYLGGIGPSSASGARSVQANVRATRSGVGGTIGSPSVQP